MKKLTFLSFFQIFLQLVGVITLATVAHELYHASAGTVASIGIQFGKNGMFFVEGRNNPGEVGAYIVTGITCLLGFSLVYYINKK